MSQQEAVPIGGLDEVQLSWFVWQIVGDGHCGENGHAAIHIGLLTLRVNHQHCHMITFLHLIV